MERREGQQPGEITVFEARVVHPDFADQRIRSRIVKGYQRIESETTRLLAQVRSDLTSLTTAQKEPTIGEHMAGLAGARGGSDLRADEQGNG